MKVTQISPLLLTLNRTDEYRVIEVSTICRLPQLAVACPCNFVCSSRLTSTSTTQENGKWQTPFNLRALRRSLSCSGSVSMNTHTPIRQCGPQIRGRATTCPPSTKRPVTSCPYVRASYRRREIPWWMEIKFRLMQKRNAPPRPALSPSVV